MQYVDSNNRISRLNSNQGFSLVELITVFILVSIVSVSMLARLNLSPFATAGFDQELRSAIRFAQKFAIMSGCDVQVNISAATDSYAMDLRNDAVLNPEDCLTAVGAFGTPLPRPIGGVFAGIAPSGVVVDNNLLFVFDLRGRPSTGGSVGLNTGSITITVEPVTGYVY